MRVVVDYPVFVSSNMTTQVFYTLRNPGFVAAYLRGGVTYMIVETVQPASFATDFVTAINVINITET